MTWSIPVVYRDREGGQATDEVIVDGLTDAQATQLRAVLHEGRDFIPAQVGWTHLGESLDGYPSEVDHPWNSLLLDLGQHVDLPADYSGEELVVLFATAGPWQGAAPVMRVQFSTG